MEEICYFDLDGCLVKDHLDIILHLEGLKRNPHMFYPFVYNLFKYHIKDFYQMNNNKELINMAKVLKGVPFSFIEEKAKKVGLNRKKRINDAITRLTDKTKRCIGILTREDQDITEIVKDKISYNLQKMKTYLGTVRGNKYEKKDGVYTGEIIELNVNGNKIDLANGKIYVGDIFDLFRHWRDPNFVRL